MSVERLKEQIKKQNFSKFYLLYGKESFLVRYYKNDLIKAILGDDRGMNFSYFEGEGINVSEILGLATTLPFFSPYRVILIENSGFFSKQNTMIDILSSIPDTTIIIFAEEEADKRLKLFKSISEQGLIINFPIETPEKLTDWIIAVLHKNEVKVSRQVASYLLYRVGNSMDDLYKEIEKLISYAYETKTITREDIEFVCHENLQDKIFKLMNSITNKERAEAFNYYYDLLDLKVSVFKILSLIIREFHLILTAKKMSNEGRNYELGSVLKVPPFAVKNYLSLAGKYSEADLTEALDYSLSLERDMKVGIIEHHVAIETLIIKYTNKKGR